MDIFVYFQDLCQSILFHENSVALQKYYDFVKFSFKTIDATCALWNKLESFLFSIVPKRNSLIKMFWRWFWLKTKVNLNKNEHCSSDN